MAWGSIVLCNDKLSYFYQEVQMIIINELDILKCRKYKSAGDD